MPSKVQVSLPNWTCKFPKPWREPPEERFSCRGGRIENTENAICPVVSRVDLEVRRVRSQSLNVLLRRCLTSVSEVAVALRRLVPSAFI